MATTAVHQFITFALGKETFALNVMNIQGVERMTNITAIPRMPAFIEGVIDLRDHIVPVIDLRKRFSLPAPPPDKSTRIIITDYNRKLVGLVVDSVFEVFQSSQDAINKLPAIGSLPIDSDFLTGVIRHKDKLVIILDINQLFTDEERTTMSIIMDNSVEKIDG